jgi:hypothetical protein
MSTEVLGTLTFSAVPSVSGSDTVLNTGGTPSIMSDITANRPAAGTIGQLFVDTTVKVLYRDNGASWDAIGSASSYTGTANQIDVLGNVLSLSLNPILPGLAGFVPPSGATADRPASPTTGITRWNSTLGYTELYNGAAWTPQGRVLQVVSGAIAATTGTSSIPVDNTPPLITEGTAIWSTSFTPLSGASRIVISFTISTSNSNTANANVLAVFYGATLAGASMTRVVANNAPGSMALQVVVTPGSTATVTVQARLGGASTTTWYCNQISTATLGGAAVTQYTITEIL